MHISTECINNKLADGSVKEQDLLYKLDVVIQNGVIQTYIVLPNANTNDSLLDVNFITDAFSV